MHCCGAARVNIGLDHRHGSDLDDLWRTGKDINTGFSHNRQPRPRNGWKTYNILSNKKKYLTLYLLCIQLEEHISNNRRVSALCFNNNMNGKDYILIKKHYSSNYECYLKVTLTEWQKTSVRFRNKTKST